MFRKPKEPPPEPPRKPLADAIFNDLPRGVHERPHKENHLTKGYFETAEHLSQAGFTDKAGFNFLGITGGRTEWDKQRKFRITKGGHAVGVQDDRHRLVVAGSRSGKGRSVIIPELLTYAGSIVVVDPKGENAAITSRYRKEKLGNKVYIIDPFRETPDHCEEYIKQFNPLKNIHAGNLLAVEDAGLIADALVVSTNSKDEYWTESAKAFIEGVILYVAVSDDFHEHERNLLTVAELIAGKRNKGIQGLLQEMKQEETLDNRISAAAHNILEKADQERGSVISTARKNLKFLDYDAMYGSLTHHDFELEQLKDEKPITVYLVLPTMRMGTCKQLLRLFVNMTLVAIERNKRKPNIPVQMIIDEAATLGRLNQLEVAIGQIAGLGLRITTIWQDLSQLKAIYQGRYESYIGNSGILQFFGNVDQQTSKWVSDYLGKTTIRYSEKSK